jgi:hypothetical protein
MDWGEQAIFYIAAMDFEEKSYLSNIRDKKDEKSLLEIALLLYCCSKSCIKFKQYGKQDHSFVRTTWVLLSAIYYVT